MSIGWLVLAFFVGLASGARLVFSAFKIDKPRLDRMPVRPDLDVFVRPSAPIPHREMELFADRWSY